LINHPAGEKKNLSNHASANALSLANAFDDYFRELPSLKFCHKRHRRFFGVALH
jgi:hypothetical protein